MFQKMIVWKNWIVRNVIVFEFVKYNKNISLLTIDIICCGSALWEVQQYFNITKFDFGSLNYTIWNCPLPASYLYHFILFINPIIHRVGGFRTQSNFAAIGHP